MRIAVFGLGYVGAVSAALLAELGHEVIGVDVNPDKVEMIATGQTPVVEPGLEEIIAGAVADGRLSATTDAAAAVAETDAALLCVGTPSTRSGGVDSRYLENVCREIADALVDDERPYVVINRSTSLPPVHQRLQSVLTEGSGRSFGPALGYVCHPEFLREGVAIDDFMNPPKIVFGAVGSASEDACSKLYPDLGAPVFHVSPAEASLIKYADNAFHAVKVTFANEIGLLSDAFGVDARSVMEVFRADDKLNISTKYLRPGNSFGGSCLPKDLRAVLDASRLNAVSLPMLEGAVSSNAYQIDQLIERLIALGERRIGIVGLAFKEGTDDVRESPAVSMVERLVGKGFDVSIFDKDLSMADLVGANRSFALESIPHLAERLAPSLADLLSRIDVVVVNHRLADDDWSHLADVKHVIDLVGIAEIDTHPGYRGIYW